VIPWDTLLGGEEAEHGLLLSIVSARHGEPPRKRQLLLRCDKTSFYVNVQTPAFCKVEGWRSARL
jgi:hypothetical protein